MQSSHMKYLLVFTVLIVAATFTPGSQIVQTTVNSASLDDISITGSPASQDQTSPETTETNTVDLQQGLKGYWRFDDPKVSRGYSLEFDGQDDFVKVDSNPSFHFEDGESFTASAWIKPRLQDSGEFGARIINDRGTGGGGSNPGWQFKIFTTNQGECSGTDNWCFYDAGIDDDTGDYKVCSGCGSSYEIGKWHHVVMRYQSDDKLSFYVNGELDGTISVGEYGGLNNSLPLGIGAAISDSGSPGSYSQWFNGSIDQILIFNRSLSSSQIEDLYNERYVSREGLVLYQDFNGGPSNCDLTSSTACLNDNSENGNDGAPHNFDNNDFNTGSGWFNETPLNRPGIKDFSRNSHKVRFYGGINGELKNFEFNSSSGWSEGKVNEYSLEFDGVDDFVKIENNPSINISGKITVSHWVKPQNLPDSGDERMWAKSGGSSGTSVAYQSYFRDKTPRFEYYADGGWRGITGSEVNVGEWYHLVYTYDGEELRLYKNGELDASSSVSVGVETNNAPLNIGFDERKDYYFDGLISTMRIYNKSITDSEAESLFQGRKVKEGLIAEWLLESGDRKTAYDTSNLGHEGVLGTSAVGFDGSEEASASEVEVGDSVSVSAWVDGRSSDRFDSDHGRFRMPSSAGEVYVETGLDADFIRLRSTPTNAQFNEDVDEGGAEYGWSHGLVADTEGGIEQMVMADGSGSSSTNRYSSRSSDNRSVLVVHAGPSGDSTPAYTLAHVNKINSTGFTLDFQRVEERNYVTYSAYDFPDSTEVDIGSFKTPETEGTKTVSKPGFKPNYLEFYSKPELDNMTDRVEVEADDFGWNFGMAAVNENGELDQQTIGHTGYANNQDSHVWASNTSQILHTLYKENTGPVDGRINARISDLIETGFDLRYTRVNPDNSTATEGQPPVMYAAIKTDLEKDVGAARTPKGTGSQEILTEANMESINFWASNTVPELNTEGFSGNNNADNHWGYMFGSTNQEADFQQAMGFSSHSNSMNGHASNSENDSAIEILYSDKNGNIIGRDLAEASDISGREIDLEWRQTQTAQSNVAFNRSVFMYSGFGEPNTVVGGDESDYSVNAKNGEIRAFIENNMISEQFRHEFTNVVLSYGSGTQKLFMEGELRSDQSLDGSVGSLNQRVEIGRGFDGKIDEVRVYNRSLSGKEAGRLAFR